MRATLMLTAAIVLGVAAGAAPQPWSGGRYPERQSDHQFANTCAQWTRAYAWHSSPGGQPPAADARCGGRDATGGQPHRPIRVGLRRRFPPPRHMCWTNWVWH